MCLTTYNYFCLLSLDVYSSHNVCKKLKYYVGMDNGRYGSCQLIYNHSLNI